MARRQPSSLRASNLLWAEPRVTPVAKRNFRRSRGGTYPQPSQPSEVPQTSWEGGEIGGGEQLDCREWDELIARSQENNSGVRMVVMHTIHSQPKLHKLQNLGSSME
eukprot:g751.t1